VILSGAKDLPRPTKAANYLGKWHGATVPNGRFFSDAAGSE